MEMMALLEFRTESQRVTKGDRNVLIMTEPHGLFVPNFGFDDQVDLPLL